MIAQRVMIAGILLSLSTVLSTSLQGCSSHDKAREAFFAEKTSCPTPATDQFEPWGQSGSAHVCIIKHGPFVAYENGFVNIRGQYNMGKESGVWVWYDRKGNVLKRTDYSAK